MNIFSYFTKEARHVRACERANVQPLYEVCTGRISPAMEDTTKDGEFLSLREVQSIAKNICPDCGGEIRWGPRGGMAQNVKCFGKCGVKFNYCDAISQRLEDRVAS